jgi:hypothetical protein
MPIPESQLETWSHQGSITQSSNTYNSVKSVLEASDTPYAKKAYKVFLQGSYGNDTNIYAESDVDIVIRLDDCFQSDLTSLSEAEKDLYKSTVSNATYTHVDFKKDVLAVLQKQYGTAVNSGDKAIAIDANSSRRKTDVISAIQYRRYSKFRSSSDFEYQEGICFWNSKGERIANYPRQHSANLTIMHQNSSRWLKPVVRVFKNLRAKMVADGHIESGLAPSYFIEGLVYNVPAEKFLNTYQDCIANTINWYRSEANKKELVCANEQYYLLRNGASTCWTEAKCDEFIEAAVKLWNEW